MRFGLFDHLDHLPKGGIPPHPAGSHPQPAELGHRRGKNVHARLNFDRHRLAGDGRLVYCGLARDYLAVHRNFLPRPDDHHLANHHLANGDLLLQAITLHPGRLWGQGGQVFHRPAGALGGKAFHIIADAHEKDDHRCGDPLPNDQRRQNPHRHQGVRGDLTLEGGPNDIAEDRPPANQNYRQAEGKGDQRGQFLK